MVLLNQSTDETVTVGYVGQALQAVSIHISPDTTSQSLTTANQFDYLTVRELTDNSEWMEVALVAANRKPWLRVGYAKSSHIAMLPYEVTLPASAFFGQSIKPPTRIRPTKDIPIDYVLGKWAVRGTVMGIDSSALSSEEQKLFGTELTLSRNRRFTLSWKLKRYSGTFAFNGKDHRITFLIEHDGERSFSRSQGNIVVGRILTNGIDKFLHIDELSLRCEKKPN